MDIKRLPARAGRYLKSLVTNGYFYIALLGIGAFCALSLLIVSKVVMPVYTRHSSFVSVPDLTNLSYEDASRILESNDLTPDRRSGKFRPDLPRDVVVEQNPPFGTDVKPGRRIYLTVNSGTVPTVVVPNVVDLAIQEAKNRLISAGLRVVETRPDPIPSPYRDTITRTSPPPGATVDKGSEAILWYSEGMGSQYVNVPDLIGMTVNQAERTLFELRLRSIAVDATAATDSIRRQSHAPGTRVREGFEVRLFTKR
ncbi:MAG: PASTA domain-containing protein [Rhodothermales bacterium]|nr:PASTA domain-containing protein [Rhodothermales bacterium]